MVQDAPDVAIVRHGLGIEFRGTSLLELRRIRLFVSDPASAEFSHRTPSNITTSTSGGADAAAAVSSARFPDLRCRLPQMARIFIGGTAPEHREPVADAAT